MIRAVDFIRKIVLFAPPWLAVYYFVFNFNGLMNLDNIENQTHYILQSSITVVLAILSLMLIIRHERIKNVYVYTTFLLSLMLPILAVYWELPSLTDESSVVQGHYFLFTFSISLSLAVDSACRFFKVTFEPPTVC